MPWGAFGFLSYSFGWGCIIISFAFLLFICSSSWCCFFWIDYAGRFVRFLRIIGSVEVIGTMRLRFSCSRYLLLLFWALARLSRMPAVAVIAYRRGCLSPFLRAICFLISPYTESATQFCAAYTYYMPIDIVTIALLQYSAICK